MFSINGTTVNCANANLLETRWEVRNSKGYFTVLKNMLLVWISKLRSEEVVPLLTFEGCVFHLGYP